MTKGFWKVWVYSPVSEIRLEGSRDLVSRLKGVSGDTGAASNIYGLITLPRPCNTAFVCLPCRQLTLEFAGCQAWIDGSCSCVVCLLAVSRFDL